MSEFTELIDKQLDAYNEKNIDKFLSCFHSEIHLCVEGDLKISGLEKFKNHYQNVFNSNPNLRAFLLERMEMFEHIIDIQEIHGKKAKNDIQQVTAKYSFKDNLISKIDFYVPVKGEAE